MRQTTAFFTALISLTTAQFSAAQGDGTIAFQSNRTGRAEIFVMDADGSNLIQVTDVPGNNEAPSLSPGGRQIAFESSRDGNAEIYVMDTDGSNSVNLSNVAGNDRNPVWSPDGTRIAFWSTRDGNAEVYVMNADGSHLVNLSNDADRFDAWPTWSPDGTRLMYISDTGLWPQQPDLFVINADGSNLMSLSNLAITSIRSRGFMVGHGGWSPDGTQILLEILQRGPGLYDIWMMNADGSDLRNLTKTSDRSEATPVWSPDGAQLVFLSTGDGAPDIWVMNSDGSNPTNLTNSSQTVDIWPSWSAAVDLATLVEAISWGQLKDQTR